MNVIEIEIDSQNFLDSLKKLADGIVHRTDLMRRLAGTMEEAVRKNFAEGGRPKWQGLKYREGKPLTDSGNLLGSITQAYDNHQAIVGTNSLYARIHNYGGVITPKKGQYLKFKIGDRWVQVKKVEIPQREFMKLTPEDEQDLIQDVQDYFQRLLD